MHGLVGFDLLAVTDWKGRTVAAAQFGESTQAAFQTPPQWPSQPSLVESGSSLYELISTPITINGEAMGDLKLGSRFELSRYHVGGDTALLRDGHVLLATLAPSTWPALERELRQGCPSPEAECEIRRNGETFVVSPVHEAWLGSAYRLVALRSLDQAVHEFTAGWLGVLIRVCGMNQNKRDWRHRAGEHPFHKGSNAQAHTQSM